MSGKPLDPTSGLELLKKARAGDKGALNELIERLRPWMKRLASQMAPQRGNLDSSDVVQDALLLVARNFQKCQANGVGQFCGWVLTIVRHEAMRVGGTRPSPKPLPEGSSAEERIPAQVDTPSEHAIQNEHREQVQQAIARLSVEDQDVILLRDYDDLEYEEIADVLDITPAVARQRHVRALKRLKKELEQFGDHSGGQT
jgi:RNA polymerase sigma-70 factor (ECF subfamily)